MNAKLVITILSALGLLVLIFLVIQIGSGSVEYQAAPQPFAEQSSRDGVSETYQCADDIVVTITPATVGSSYTLVTPAGESVMVREQSSPSGQRFENMDGNVIWQHSGEEAFLEELGIVTAAECVRESMQASGQTRPVHNQLAATSWEWLGVDYSDGETVTPDQPDIFILNFTNQTAMSTLTDCNSVRGTYKLGEQRRIVFSDLSSTRMFCEDSQEGEFQAVLQEAERWRQVNDQLLLELADSAGTSTFRKTEVVVQ